MRKFLILLIIIATGLAWLPQQKQPSQQKKQPSPLTASKQRGKKVYDLYCLACHQADGAGVPRMNPPLIKTGFVLGDKKKLIPIVLEGMTAGVEIDGESYSNPMAPHNFLKDQEIADVLTYVRNSFGNKASMVNASEVKTIRAKIGTK